MECQSLFSRKNKKNISICHLLSSLPIGLLNIFTQHAKHQVAVSVDWFAFIPCPAE